MRKNVLFIAKFDNVLKGMNTVLSKSFNMQVCPPEPLMAEKILGVMDIDLVLFYISGLPLRILSGLCNKLKDVSFHTPILVFGTAEECTDFDAFCSITISKYMHRPLSAQDIMDAINELLDPQPELEEPEEPQSHPHTQDKNNMSIFDFADSLDSDERRCVLLVDDDGRILRAIKMLLEKNYKINLANSGKSALESIHRERPDAVLLDYEMPVMDGKQTLELIRQNEETKDLPVFFLTGVADKERIREVIHLRPQGYILKSSEQSTIIETLENFFQARD